MVRVEFEGLHKELQSILGDISAARMCFDYFIVAQYWDDLIDRDNELSDDEIHDAFYTSLVSIPNNPFYQKYQHKITPILEVTIYKWLQSNKYENDCKELNKAYMLRAGLYDLFSLAYITIHGLSGGANIYDLYGETFDKYKKEIICQTQ